MHPTHRRDRVSTADPRQRPGADSYSPTRTTAGTHRAKPERRRLVHPNEGGGNRATGGGLGASPSRTVPARSEWTGVGIAGLSPSAGTPCRLSLPSGVRGSPPPPRGGLGGVWRPVRRRPEMRNGARATAVPSSGPVSGDTPGRGGWDSPPTERGSKAVRYPDDAGDGPPSGAAPRWRARLGRWGSDASRGSVHSSPETAGQRHEAARAARVGAVQWPALASARHTM